MRSNGHFANATPEMCVCACMCVLVGSYNCRLRFCYKRKKYLVCAALPRMRINFTSTIVKNTLCGYIYGYLYVCVGV